jgi:predicted metal-dependent HD superfamily phosphohydrolase
MKSWLQKRWYKIWEEFQSKGDRDRVWQLIKSSYQESHRYYHNLSHVVACLKCLDFAREENVLENDRSYLLVDMALWFHDLIYDPHADKNEDKSAALFAEIATSAQISKESIDRIIHLILLTKHHSISSTPEEMLMSDCDLSILAAIDLDYQKYALAIRQEYSFVEEAVYRHKRSQVLQSFLRRSRIFQTPLFYQKFEIKARKNIQSELFRIKS